MGLKGKRTRRTVVRMTETILRPFQAEDTDWLVDQHAFLYASDDGFDDTFGPLVRSILDGYVSDHDPACEQGWIAEADGARLGSIFCVRHDQQTAKLRLFLLVPQARGRGVGRMLLQRCMGFARDSGYAGMTLWTHESHRAACALYARTGWELTASKPVHSFGQDLVEQTWVYRF
nr:GNAT family N-acetyltransferase [uncultured Tateyamaria sp.]